MIRLVAVAENAPVAGSAARFDVSRVEEVLKRRTPIYRRMAHFEVDTDRQTIEAVASQICRFVDSWRQESDTDSCLDR